MPSAVLCLASALLVQPLAAPARAQQAPDSSAPATLVLDVASETENHLRYLQTLGGAPLGQWSIRGFAPAEVRALVAPGTLRSFERPVQHLGNVDWQVRPLIADAWYNSDFAFGQNDGAVWRGRGLTTALRGGVALRAGPLSVVLQPMVFRAENRGFAMMSNGRQDSLAYGDPLRPTGIDRPQRFGDGAYGRLDPGQSTIRLDAFGVSVGVSTANEWWGPMSTWPYILSDNAAGFPHAFAGSSSPWDVGVGRIHGRVLYGELSQSDYTNVTVASGRRFAAGAIGSFMPRGLSGLEIGVARFFEQPWPAGGIGWAELRKPINPFLKVNVAGDSGLINNSSLDNQLVSIFARWTFPASGLEIYGEFGRDDHSWDSRDLTMEPDHAATLGLGMRKAWRAADGRVTGLHAELFDLDPSALGRNRNQGSKYANAGTRQGHTQRGQVLGAGFAAINGAGSMLAWERYSPNDEKLHLALSRMVVRERAATATIAPSIDVQYALTGEHTRRLGRLGITYGLTAVYELNRYFQDDAVNVQPSLRVVW